jgi:hypothetical protein
MFFGFRFVAYLVRPSRASEGIPATANAGSLPNNNRTWQSWRGANDERTPVHNSRLIEAGTESAVTLIANTP